jgi:hypothetical protein
MSNDVKINTNNMDNLKSFKYYVMNVTKGCNITYMYTGDRLPEGQYYVNIRGILKNSEKKIHTILASVVAYNDNVDIKQFNQYENVVAISVTEEPPTFTDTSFFDKIKCCFL